ncbi:acyl-CoA dehydrogenase, partial [Pseudoalteromonas ruthenica]|uniref:acyl-CoA dehydrogenase domain-containing protein n=1 Tax=Pseudoalteromonas ruthenica TaxID=151081 RepID=UPI001108FFBD
CPQNPLASGCVALPIGITGLGANLLTRTLLIFGQGVMLCHPYLQNKVEAIHSQEKDADATFNRILRKTVRYSTANGLRAFKHGKLPFTASSQSNLPEVRDYQKPVLTLSSRGAVYAYNSLL